MTQLVQIAHTRNAKAPVRLTPLAVALGLGLGIAPATYAATFTVTTLADSGVGSLRDAITQANVAGGADTVDFLAGLTGTITLATEIAITDSVTVTGPGAAVINIMPGGTNRSLNITGTPAVTIAGLTFTGNGTANVDGGAIQLKAPIGTTTATVTIQNCVFTGNVTTSGDGGALFLYNGGAMNIQSSTFTGNQSGSRGGAIKFYHVGPVSVTGSTFSGNQAPAGRGGAMFFYKTTGATITGSTITGNTTGAGRGGGIFFYKPTGVTTIADSTISGNSAGRGGALFFYKVYNSSGTATISGSTISGNTAASQGGGIFFYTAQVAVVNSTISGNTVTNGTGGGIYLYDSQVTVNNSTLTGNTSPIGTAGGVYVSDTSTNVLTLNSTIVANSTDSTSTRDIVVSAGTVNATNSLVENTTGVTFAVNTANIFGVDPALGPLANNGGPTQTHALLTGSPAIDTGANPLALAFDQRGTPFARTAAAQTDIGAFEVQGIIPPPPTPVTVVPTLSQWGVVVLSALTGIWAVVTGFGRRRRRS